MRFQLGTGATYPTPPPAPFGLGGFMKVVDGVDTSLQWDLFDGPSGESGIIIPGVVEPQGVTLSQIVASWGGLNIAGRLEVRTNPDKPICVLFQTAPSGTLTVQLNDLPVNIESYGLRCDNSSVEGEYVVIIYYRHI